MLKLLTIFTIFLLINFVYLFRINDDDDQQQLDKEWINFKNQYHRMFKSIDDENYRKEIFLNNLKFINEHNQLYDNGQSSFQLGINQFADKTIDEFRRQYNGFKLSKNSNKNLNIYDDNNIETLPDEIDWTKKGIVAPIKNQEQCGSCWAFSAISTIESAHALATGKLVELSEQELVDCSFQEGNYGCEGGWPDNGFQFVIDNNGIETERSYPYVGVDENCKSSEKNKTIGATISKYVDVKKDDENALQSACAKIGPISVAIDASSSYFMLYKSGVYDHDDCSTTLLDHAVVVVGYGTKSNKKYWKVRNSWGTSWGMNGYILMSRDKNNQCGIASKASYPVV